MGFLSKFFGKGKQTKAKKPKSSKGKTNPRKTSSGAGAHKVDSRSPAAQKANTAGAVSSANELQAKAKGGIAKARAVTGNAKKKIPTAKKKPTAKKLNVRGLQLEEIIDITAGQANKRLSYIAYSTITVLLILICALVFLSTRPPEPAHVVTVDPQGNVNPLPSFMQPPSSPTVIMNLAQRYTLELLEMNALNYEQRILDNAGLFIGEDYFRVYQRGLVESVWFQGMIDGRLSMTGVPTDLPIISNSGTYSAALGMTQWQVQVPVRIRIEGPGVQPRIIERTMIFQLVHARSPEYRAGIAIAGMRMERR